MELLFYLIALIYAVLILIFIIGFIKLKPFKLDEFTPSHKFSIVIPFRNEARNLPALLESLAKLEYPAAYFELLFIDDFSEDDSVKIIEKFHQNHPQINLRILQNSLSTAPKKNAITLAVSAAKNNWILTTDADCEVPKTWLKAFNKKIDQTDLKMICAPVKLNSVEGLTSLFEILNFNSLQGATMGSFGWDLPILCNGANLCYSKTVFQEVNGFQGNDTIASGDDIFLLEKIVKNYPGSVRFIKTRAAMVTTKTQKSFNHFINQQLRWAAKSKAYQNVLTKIVGSIVILQNASLIALTILVVFQKMDWDVLMFSFLLKLALDTVLICQSLHFYKQEKLALASFPMSLIYPIFSVLTIVLTLFGKYQWKNRSFKS